MAWVGESRNALIFLSKLDNYISMTVHQHATASAILVVEYACKSASGLTTFLCRASAGHSWLYFDSFDRVSRTDCEEHTKVMP